MDKKNPNPKRRRSEMREEKLEQAILLIRDVIIERLQQERYCEAQNIGRTLEGLLGLRVQHPTGGVR